jgi:putative hydrolases of HD superfamily
MSLESLTDFLVTTNPLKYTMRYGSCPESFRDSTAAHSWNLCRMIPFVVAELGLDINVLHAMNLANFHDLPEYVRKKDFDSFLVSKGILSKEEKEKEEIEVIENLRNKFSVGELVYSLWKEYQEGKTAEAKFVKALDKIETNFHFIERGNYIDNKTNWDYQATYSDNAVKGFPQLEPLLRVAKSRLRIIAESNGIIWRQEYNYPD